MNYVGNPLKNYIQGTVEAKALKRSQIFLSAPLEPGGPAECHPGGPPPCQREPGPEGAAGPAPRDQGGEQQAPGAQVGHC